MTAIIEKIEINKKVLESLWVKKEIDLKKIVCQNIYCEESSEWTYMVHGRVGKKVVWICNNCADHIINTVSHWAGITKKETLNALMNKKSMQWESSDQGKRPLSSYALGDLTAPTLTQVGWGWETRQYSDALNSAYNTFIDSMPIESGSTSRVYSWEGSLIQTSSQEESIEGRSYNTIMVDEMATMEARESDWINEGEVPTEDRTTFSNINWTL